ncbi:MAG: Lrp/AsnC ligand binding domain-containing protein [Deltaproteobacteria bacterium]|nr:Lrp/AsnC ligand binding domain-containing protein [Deltaproteobacteria bacterium]MBW2305954.1 Lrp/AsnC ligand binding domain-containing protein [Deltaproteobacteria bacterium]
MVTAIVLIHADRKMINETAEELVKTEGISEVYSVAGQWDLVAVVRAKDNELLADIITNHMLRLPGILKTETLIAFRALSRYDLERLFSIGFEHRESID